MAWDHSGNRVGPDGGTYSTLASGVAGNSCDLAVGGDLSRTNSHKCGPDGDLKGGAKQMEREGPVMTLLQRLQKQSRQRESAVSSWRVVDTYQ